MDSSQLPDAESVKHKQCGLSESCCNDSVSEASEDALIPQSNTLTCGHSLCVEPTMKLMG